MTDQNCGYCLSPNLIHPLDKSETIYCEDCGCVAKQPRDQEETAA